MKSFTIFILSILVILIFNFFSCKDPEAERKIDANLRFKMNSLKESARLDENVSVVFKTNEPLTDEHKAVLQKKGIRVMANIGNIYTATLPVKRVYDLAKMRFVESIQGSKEFKAHPIDSSRTIQKL